MTIQKTDYPNLRESIHPNYRNLPDARIESLLESHDMDAEAMEGFFGSLAKFASGAGQAVLKAAPSILPLAGQVVGTAFGGPVGSAIGGSLGSLAGRAVGAASGQKPSGSAAGLGGLLGGLGGLLGGSSSAGKLLQTVLKPETMQALASMAMGPLGKPNVSVGGTPVPIGAFGNLLKTLSGRVEAEYNASLAASEGVPEYLRSYTGEALADPAVGVRRAEVLFEMLEASESGESEQEAAESAEAESLRYEQEMAAIQAEYDAIELMEVYESEEA
jgi:hypothetical protein